VISEKWYFAPDGTLTQGEYKIERQLETALWQNKAQEIERELGPRKNGKLDGKWIKEYENTATWEKTKSEWEFKNWELWSGKITNAKWELVKEMYQGQEVIQGETSFEDMVSIDEVYRQLDELWSIYSKDAKRTYTTEEIKDMIRKWETWYIPVEWGLRMKIEELTKFTEWPKVMFDSKDFEQSYQLKEPILNWLRNRWQYYDKNFADFNLDTPFIKYWWVFAWRPIVEVKMPNWNSEYFYKSTWWAWKAWEGAWWTTNGMWQVFWWFANAHIAWHWKVNGRFIKDSWYQNYYWSKTFENIAKSLDDVMIEKMWLQNVSELNVNINFQNSKINTFVPQW
jgi:hypothetical protein